MHISQFYEDSEDDLVNYTDADKAGTFSEAEISSTLQDLF